MSLNKETTPGSIQSEYLKTFVAVIDHTFVHESLRGQGVAGKLMEEAVAAIEAQGWKVGASCSYAVSWLEKRARREEKP